MKSLTDHQLELETFGSPVLTRKSAPLKEITPEIRELADEMIAAMQEFDGIGLAAPQIGHNIRLITICTMHEGETLSADASPGELLLCPMMPLALVNPEFLWLSEQTGDYVEGCLSVPGLDGTVKRPVALILRATLITGGSITIECGGLLARCLQHEVDHLNGVLFVDRMPEEDRDRLTPKLNSLKKQTLRLLRKRV